MTCSCATGQLPGIDLPAKVDSSAPVSVSSLGPQQTSDIETYILSSDADFYWGTPLAVLRPRSIFKRLENTLDGTEVGRASHRRLPDVV